VTLPDVLVERLGRIWPADHLERGLASLGAAKDPHVRLNPLRGGTLADLVDAGLHPEPVGWLPEGARVPVAERDALVRSAPVLDGRAWVQNPSSWLPVIALDARPGEEVLDLAAAPGGKTTHLAARMANEGRLAAVEPVRDRFFRLQAAVRRAGATIVVLYLKDGRAVGRQVPGRFDRVLLDAPCSSEARIDADDASTWAHWSPRKVRECAHKQVGLLASAYAALKSGGVLVYSTCSFAPEEDEAVVDALLRRHPEAEVLPTDVPAATTQAGLTTWDGDAFDPAVARCVRVLPDEVFDGFFLARLRKP
jgi:16S rRNA (cytosine1407-C5)-methyltransferase